MKKVLTLVMTAAIILSLLTGCGGTKQSSGSQDAAPTPASSSKQKISILLGKPEILKPFEEMVSEYNSTHPNVEVTVVPLAEQNAYEKMTSLYASGNAPTIMMMGQEYQEFQPKLLDLSDQPWASHAMAGSLDYVTKDGKVYGMPVTVEAFGLIYSKKLADQAVGGNFDPAAVKTTKDLEGFFEKLSKLDGKSAIHISPMDWSLGAHQTNLFFSAQSSDHAARHQFLADIKAGKVSLKDNAVFTGWLDTFDVMKRYNSEKKAPLAPTYDAGPLALAEGKVGVWFMGNWAWPQISEADPGSDYGFLPVPISNNPGDYGNGQLSVGVPSYWTIDASQNTPEQQAAAKEFLNWFVGDSKGQDYYVNSLNLIPVYDNFTIKPSDSLTKSIMSYMESNNTLEWMNTYYPPDGWPKMGAAMQKYLDNKIDRAALIKEIEDYWKTAK